MVKNTTLYIQYSHRRAAAQRKLEEEATNKLIAQLLEEEKKERERSVQSRTYMCAICFTDVGINDLYVLDGCFHRYCITVRISTHFLLIFVVYERLCNHKCS